MAVCVKGCSHVRFWALRLTSWSMCLTDESVEDKLQQSPADILLHRLSWVYYIHQDDNDNVRFRALRLTSWSTYLTDENADDKPQQIISGYLDGQVIMSLLHTPGWQAQRAKSHMKTALETDKYIQDAWSYTYFRDDGFWTGSKTLVIFQSLLAANPGKNGMF